MPILPADYGQVREQLRLPAGEFAKGPRSMPLRNLLISNETHEKGPRNPGCAGLKRPLGPP